MSAATASALAALHASIADEKARHAYWTAFAKFMRFELEKPDFDRVAVAALGPHVAQHNAVIMALLKDAQNGQDPFAATSELQIFGVPEAQHAANGGGASSGASASAQGAAGAAGTSGQPAAAGPKLMLKIGMGRGGMEASATRPELRVDPQEEAQLNALHERLHLLARQHGLSGVQPEAVSFMQRAVKSVTNRLIVASSVAATDGVPPPPDAGERSVAMEDVQEAIRNSHSTPAPWMAPPCQRASQQLGAFRKFAT